MFRRNVVVTPHDPYEYVVYNSLDKDESNLEHKLSFHRLCTLLRRFEYVDEYTVDYWNKLFKYFCKTETFKENFCNIEQVKDSFTLESSIKRLS